MPYTRRPTMIISNECAVLLSTISTAPEMATTLFSMRHLFLITEQPDEKLIRNAETVKTQKMYN